MFKKLNIKRGKLIYFNFYNLFYNLNNLRSNYTTLKLVHPQLRVINHFDVFELLISENSLPKLMVYETRNLLIIEQKVNEKKNV